MKYRNEIYYQKIPFVIRREITPIKLISNDDLNAVSNKLFEENQEAYEELGK